MTDDTFAAGLGVIIILVILALHTTFFWAYEEEIYYNGK